MNPLTPIGHSKPMKVQSNRYFLHKPTPFPPNQLFHCCVPGCSTYDVSAKFLNFPTDCVWRQKWLSAIPTKNMVIDHNSMICLKHFDSADVAIFTHFVAENRAKPGGRNITPLIREGACPVHFPKETDIKMSELKVGRP